MTTLEERVDLLERLTAGIPQPPRGRRRKRVKAVYELARNLEWARDTGLITAGEEKRIGMMANLLIALAKRDKQT